MRWSPQQDRAIADVKAWLTTAGAPQVFRLFGYAGTGKTTLAKEMARCVRGSGLYATFTGKASLVLRQKGCTDASQEELRQIVLDADQLLCGLNRTRTAYNRRIRILKGLVGQGEPWHPTKGDRLICLKNKRDKQLFNGAMWQADTVGDKFRCFSIEATSLDEERDPLTLEVAEEFFSGNEHKIEWKERRRYDEFTFGWAITCHKSQGSQWNNVVVFDESSAFREDRAKWLYTAITRAADRVTVVV